MTSNSKFIPRQLKGLMTFLAIEFILGMTLMTLLSYDSHKHSGVRTGFLIAHIVVGIGLLISAVVRLVVALRTKFLRKPSFIGLVGIVAAFGSGIAAARNHGSSVAIFLMAIFFLVAFMAYGYSLSRAIARSA